MESIGSEKGYFLYFVGFDIFFIQRTQIATSPFDYTLEGLGGKADMW